MVCGLLNLGSKVCGGFFVSALLTITAHTKLHHCIIAPPQCQGAPHRPVAQTDSTFDGGYCNSLATCATLFCSLRKVFLGSMASGSSQFAKLQLLFKIQRRSINPDDEIPSPKYGRISTFVNSHISTSYSSRS